VRCAVLNESGVVVNIAVANPARDKPPEGHVFLPINDGEPVRKGWRYTSEIGLVDPEIEARAFDDSVTAKAWAADGQADVRRTTNPDEVNAIFRASFKTDHDYAAGFAKRRGLVFVDGDKKSAIAVMPKSRILYTGVMAAVPGHAGRQVLACMMDKVAHHLFAHTPCLFVRNSIPADNTAMIDIAKRSAARVDESADPVRHEYSIVDWARAIGPKRAVRLVHDAGKTGKAKLMAAKIRGAV